jgi:hypothetical protein
VTRAWRFAPQHPPRRRTTDLRARMMTPRPRRRPGNAGSIKANTETLTQVGAQNRPVIGRGCASAPAKTPCAGSYATSSPPQADLSGPKTTFPCPNTPQRDTDAASPARPISTLGSRAARSKGARG